MLRSREQIDEADVADLAELLLSTWARHTTESVIRPSPCSRDDGQVGASVDPIHLSDLVEFIVVALSNALTAALIKGKTPGSDTGNRA
jgi:hypothetical protein